MKKTLKIMLLGIVALFLLTGGVWAASYTYSDNYANWPGWIINSNDVIGTPSITELTVNIDDNSGYLSSVVINMTDRRVWDGLFINNDWNGSYNDYQSWDYYVVDPEYSAPVLYAVQDSFDPSVDYMLATQTPPYVSGRWGHPAGIKAFKLESPAETNLFSGVYWSGSTLTYSFNTTDGGITLGDDGSFVIGYSPWCSNDVFLTPVGVPEPGILLLLGIGLVGLAGVGRKFKK